MPEKTPEPGRRQTLVKEKTSAEIDWIEKNS